MCSTRKKKQQTFSFQHTTLEMNLIDDKNEKEKKMKKKNQRQVAHLYHTQTIIIFYPTIQEGKKIENDTCIRAKESSSN